MQEQIDQLIEQGNALSSDAPDSARTIINKALELAEENNLLVSVGLCYRILGLAESHKGDFEKAHDYEYKALVLFTELNDSLRMADAHMSIGNIYKWQHRLDDALDHQLKALHLYEVCHAEGDRTATSYNNIGAIYRLMKSLDEAMQFQQKALAIQAEAQDTSNMIRSYLSIGLIHYDQMRNDTAIVFYKKGLALAEAYNRWTVVSTAHAGLGSIYYKMGDYEKAKHHHHQSLELNRKHGHPLLVANVLHNIGLLHKKIFPSSKMPSKPLMGMVIFL